MTTPRIEDLSLLCIDTKDVVNLGPGYRDWPLLAFRGPVFNTSRVWGQYAPSRPRLLLPADLLELLYERMAQLNPRGLLIAETEELDDLEFGPEVTEDERNRLYDAGEVGWDVFDHRIPPHDRDPIRRYLPELFEPAVMDRILADPALDSGWHRLNRPGKEFNFGWDVCRHYRWSDWWLQAGDRPADQTQPTGLLKSLWDRVRR